MKLKAKILLMVVASLVYWAGLSNASAFYDPGAQRWLNRDPLGEPGFVRIFPELSLMQKNMRAHANAGVVYPTLRTAMTVKPWEGIPAELDQYPNLYLFAGNEPVTVFDFEGLSGCGNCYGNSSDNRNCYIVGGMICAPTLVLPFDIIIWGLCTVGVHNLCCFALGHL